MKRPAGFTLVELLTAITIMLVLITLAVISLRGNEATARDEKRKTDATLIAQHLESFYDTGSDTAAAGQYPNTSIMDTETEVRASLRDLDPTALRAPDVAASSPISLIVATTNATQSPTISQYIYQPLTSSNALCTSSSTECRKFNLFYRLEGSGIQTITSTRQ